MRGITAGITWLALLATALSAGFFYTYSISVMPGLDAAEPAAAVGAMQGINAVIRTPEFAFAFFGALLLPVAAGALHGLGGSGPAALLAVLAGIVYAPAVVAVTFLVNVPLNDGLAAVGPADGHATDIWSRYTAPWTAWNHVRMAGAIAAFALMAAAAVVGGRPRAGQPGRMGADAPESG